MKKYEQTGNTVHRPGENLSEMRCVRMSKNLANDEVLLVAATNSSPLVRLRVKTSPQRTKAIHPRRQFLLFGGQYTYEVDDVYRYHTRRRHVTDVTAVRATHVTQWQF
jgi:hypothetical protein